MKHFVYVLLSDKDKKWYVGRTNRTPEERLKEHNSGGSDSTRPRRPFRLIYSEMYLDVRDAVGRELFLKGGSGHRYLKKQLKNYLQDSYRGVEQPGSSSGS